MDKNIKNAPNMVFFFQDFFQKSGSITFVPLWCTNFVQNFRKH